MEYWNVKISINTDKKKEVTYQIIETHQKVIG